jgi:hypothetical protein
MLASQAGKQDVGKIPAAREPIHSVRMNAASGDVMHAVFLRSVVDFVIHARVPTGMATPDRPGAYGFHPSEMK